MAFLKREGLRTQRLIHGLVDESAHESDLDAKHIEAQRQANCAFHAFKFYTGTKHSRCCEHTVDTLRNLARMLVRSLVSTLVY